MVSSHLCHLKIKITVNLGNICQHNSKNQILLLELPPEIIQQKDAVKTLLHNGTAIQFLNSCGFIVNYPPLPTQNMIYQIKFIIDYDTVYHIRYISTLSYTFSAFSITFYETLFHVGISQNIPTSEAVVLEVHWMMASSRSS